MLKNKVALITGGTGAIGQTIAKFFVREGCSVILSGRSQAKLNDIKKSFLAAADIRIIPADVSLESDVKNLIQGASAAFGRLDILVAGHGIYGEIGPLAESRPADWIKAVTANLLGTTMCIRYALPWLQKSRRGKIITFAGGGEGALPNFSSYAASKAGVLRLTETLARERGFETIDINAISPGAVASGLTKDLLAAGKEKAGQEMYEKNLQQLEAGGESPEKAAQLAVFLASDEANGLSGKNISAVWDNWRAISKHLEEIMESDIYTARRIKPKDRHYDW